MRNLSPRIGIVGGGPGGLMTALLLKQQLPNAEATIFEASSRCGGKVHTNHFAVTGMRYEVGAAELYDYSHLGPDPLRKLIEDLGLSIAPMTGPGVIFDGRWLMTDHDLQGCLGEVGAAQVRAFETAARTDCTPAEYYESDWRSDLRDQNSNISFATHLDAVTDSKARRYIETVVHSDLATEPERTSALYGLQNWLMNDPDYMRLYYIEGGNDLLIDRILARLDCSIRLQTRVQRISGNAQSGYDLTVAAANGSRTHHFDAVVVALPVNQLGLITWESPSLAAAIRSHRGHYDYPAHYLRITLVFERAFWRDQFPGDYFMIDAFGGCCVYDESARDPKATRGVLGWLLAGDAALVYANLSDRELVKLVLTELPASVRHGATTVIESAVHRWVGAVNGWPMGRPIQEPKRRHLVDPAQHPSFCLVGDYLFDSTLNGVLDSAELAAKILSEWAEQSSLPR